MPAFCVRRLSQKLDAVAEPRRIGTNAYSARRSLRSKCAMAARREPMSSVDTAWLHMDRPTNPMMIVGLMRFRRRLDFERLKEIVAERFLAFQRLRMRPVESLTGVVWEEDEDFRLDRHVRRMTLSPPGNEHALAELVAQLLGRRLNPRYPRWQYDLIEGVGKGCALMVRIHHCYADGIALMRVLLSLADPMQEPDALRAPAAEPEPTPAQSWLELLTPAAINRALREGSDLVGRGLHLALHPGELGEMGRQGVGIAAELARVALLADDAPTPLRGKLSTHKRVAWCRPVPLEIARSSAHALGCTINDVLTAAVAGAFGTYLRDAGVDVSGMSIRATVPVNLRPPGEPTGLGNQFGLVFMPLPIGIANPVDRIYAVHAQMQALRQSPQPLMSMVLLAVLGLGPKTLQQPAVDLLSNKATLVMSNVPGPRTPMKLGGVPIDEVLFWVPQSGNLGIGVSVLTYKDRVHFGLIADRNLIPEPQRVADEFERQVRDLVSALPSPAARPPAALSSRAPGKRPSRVTSGSASRKK
jgi:WS/DGAT/MGAT family acyltransferase